MRNFSFILLGASLLLAGFMSANAQTGTRVNLFNLQTAAFPNMTVGLDVFNSDGSLVTGLTLDSINLLEDDQVRQIDGLEEKQPGVQFALALDPSRMFAYQDARGVSRYTKVEQILKDWAGSHPDTIPDDLSLIPTSGASTTHLTTASAFSDALVAYSPILLSIVPSLNTLSLALDTVSEQKPQPGMKPVVLYVTSVPSQDAVLTLENLTQRAADQHIRVFVWIVDSQDSFDSTAANALKDLAIQTSGQYITFSGEEPLPGLETYLAPLRHSYQLTYNSGILTSGGHSLEARVNLNGETVSSAILPFELDIEPPNPILVSPPVQIVRQAPDSHTVDATEFLPTEQVIDIIVEFPDRRTRPLIRTTLYVDNQKEAENTAEPFDQFIWDLRNYSESGQHSLSVEALDSYGLSKVSLEVPVTITVIQPERGFLAFLARYDYWVVIAAILVAGGVLAIVLAWGHLRRHFRPAGGKNHGEYLAGQSGNDPLTQLVTGEQEDRRTRRLRARPAKQADAYLLRLKEDNQPATSPPIPLTSAEMTFGSDPIQATRVLDDPSISPLHACLKLKDGEYILSDEKSVAGTWVNYEQLKAPHTLKHGDVIHIGRFSYRFMLRKPSEATPPRIIPTK